MHPWMLWSSVAVALMLAFLTGIHVGKGWERAQQTGFTWEEDAAARECLEVLEENLAAWNCSE